MENEASDLRSTYEVDGIGSIRTMNGTALGTIAGAASYWEKEAKALRRSANKQWRDGFLTGSVSVGSLTLVIVAISRVFF